MSNLIQELKNQHKEILNKIIELRNFNISFEEIKIKFSELEKLLSEHIKKEDTELYPILFEKAKDDEILEKNLNIFAKEWKEISDFIKKYFESYYNSNNKQTLNRGVLYAKIKQRIMREEISLFSEYEKISKQ